VLREALTNDRLRSMEPNDVAAYFASYEAEGLTSAERDLMEQWLSDDGAHATALARAKRAWSAFDDADGDEILSAMRNHALADPVPRWRLSSRAIAAVAALFLVTMGTLLLLPRFGHMPQQGGSEGVTIDYASTATRIRQVALPDGSHLTLDADSAVRGRFAKDARDLTLVRGRVFLDVRHDPTRPFTVTAMDRRIVDLGTRFSASVLNGSLRVALEQGRVSIVSLKAGVATVELKPGEEFVATGTNAKIGKVGQRDADANWRHGLIDLDDIRLVDAAAQINRYSSAQIVIRDPRIAELRVTGQFRLGDAERFARTIAELHSVRVQRRGSTIEMLPSK